MDGVGRVVGLAGPVNGGSSVLLVKQIAHCFTHMQCVLGQLLLRARNE